MRKLFVALVGVLLAYLPSPVFAQSANPFNPDYSWCATQGSIATRNGSRWACLTPGTSGQVLRTNGAGANASWAPAGAGSVTSVGLVLPTELTVTGSPVTSSGTLTGAWTSQTANQIFAAPSGTAGTPAFRSMLALDMPNSGVAAGGNVTGTWPNLTASVSASQAQFEIGHRLTFFSLRPIMEASVTNGNTVYSAPYTNDILSLWDGTNFVPTHCAQTSQLLTDTTKSPAATAGSSNYDMFAWNDAGTCRVTRGPVWTNQTSRSAGTALRRVNGTWINDVAITNGPAAGFGTYMGTFRTSNTNSVVYQPGLDGSFCTQATNGIWNMYNRTVGSFQSMSSTASNSTATSASYVLFASNCSVAFIRGLVGNSPDVNINDTISLLASGKATSNVRVVCSTNIFSLNVPIGGFASAQTIQYAFSYTGDVITAADLGLCVVEHRIASDGTNLATWLTNGSSMSVNLEY